jgi:hypothetical protein
VESGLKGEEEGSRERGLLNVVGSSVLSGAIPPSNASSSSCLLLGPPRAFNGSRSTVDDHTGSVKQDPKGKNEILNGLGNQKGLLFFGFFGVFFFFFPFFLV